MKKFIKKMIKKTEGFTLVELIVVIAILGILAGIAVPAYSGYLTKAKEAGDIVTLDAVKTAAQAYNAQTGNITDLTVTEDTVKIGSDEIQEKDAFKLYMMGDSATGYSIDLQSETYANGATWSSSKSENGGWTPIS